MFARVLVATDLTGATRASLRAAFDLARGGDGEVLLFHVVRRIPGLTDRELRAFYQRLKNDAQARMLELTRWFSRERDVEIACEIVVGQPAREIVAAARRRRSDVIVLAHSEGKAPLGSVSYKVVQEASCAVLVLKGPAEAHVLATSGARRRGRAPAEDAARPASRERDRDAAPRRPERRRSARR